MTLPELAIRRHVTTLMILTSTVVLGAVALTRVPLAFEPDMEEPELFVHLPYPNAAPEQVERTIVRPVEDALGSVNGLKRMWSRCGDEGGMVRLELDWSADMNLARVEIWEKLDRIRRDLPDDIGDITVGEHWSNRESDDPILEGRLASELDLSESYDLLERRIVRPLLRVPGVAQVKLDGVVPKEVRINLRLDDLEAHGVDVRDVREIIRRSNSDRTVGKLTDGETRYVVRMVGTLRSVKEIENLPLRSDGLKLRDVADIVYAQPDLDFGRHLEMKPAIGITVSAESSANVVEVCDRLEERIAELESDPHLEGIDFLTWMNQGREIKNTLRELAFSGIFGAILASVVLFLFLRRVSTTVVSVLCIPFSLIVTCGIIWARGSTLNTLSLLGLIVGIGMLVDNAVVVIENIFRHQELGHDRKKSALLGSREVSTAVIAATLTSVIVFLPIVFNKPNEMTIPMKEIGITICFTLLASLCVSQTLIPLATSWFIRAKPKPKERWIVWLEDRYEKLLAINLRHRWLAFLVGIPVAIATWHPIQKIDFDFDRQKPQLYAQIGYRFSENVTLDYKEATVTKVEKMLMPLKEELNAKSVYSWFSDSFTMTRVYAKDGQATPEVLGAMRERLREIVPDIAGVRIDVHEPGSHWRRNRGKRVSFQIRGEDPAIIARLAEEAKERITPIEGLIQPFADTHEGQHELHVALDRDLMSRYELRMSQTASAVSLAFRGQRMPRFRTPTGEREMRLTLDEREVESESQLYNVPLWSPTGEKIRLAAVANFHEELGSQRIERNDRQTSVWVGASYREGRKEDYVPHVEVALADMDFPDGYWWTFGDWQEREAAKTRGFLIDLSLALLLVFAVMAGLFESMQRAIALLIALPFALAGAFWTLHLTGTDFDQPAAVGVLLLIGIVVNNGIVLIEHINQYQRQGMPRLEAMLRGGRERLRPILMTAVTTLIGMLPIVIQQPALGGMYYHSMAFVLMGGLAVSTFLTAVLLPTTATLVEDFFSACWRILRRFLPGRNAASETNEPNAPDSLLKKCLDAESTSSTGC